MNRLTKRVIIDTNVVSVTFLGNTSAARKCRRYLLDTFDEVCCAVVLHEIIRGSQKPKKTQRHWEPGWKILIKNIDPNHCATPIWIDWKIAGIAVHEMNHKMSYSMCKNAIRKMTNDALIASVCIRHKASLLTCDKDFYALRKTRQLSELEIIDWNKLKPKALASF